MMGVEDEWLTLEPINSSKNWPTYLIIALMVVIVLGTMGYVLHLEYVAAERCEAAGGVWVTKPGACVQPNQGGPFP